MTIRRSALRPSNRPTMSIRRSVARLAFFQIAPSDQDPHHGHPSTKYSHPKINLMTIHQLTDEHHYSQSASTIIGRSASWSSINKKKTPIKDQHHGQPSSSTEHLKASTVNMHPEPWLQSPRNSVIYQCMGKLSAQSSAHTSAAQWYRTDECYFKSTLLTNISSFQPTNFPKRPDCLHSLTLLGPKAQFLLGAPAIYCPCNTCIKICVF